MSEITKEQQDIISSLKCVRLTSDEAHKTLIQGFINHRNNGLAASLRQEAWEDDADGSVAYYIVKDASGNALFFFSLKCGALFNHLNEEQIQHNAKLWNALERIIENSGKSDPTAILIMEKLRTGKNLTTEELTEYIKGFSAKKRRLIESLMADKQADANENIVRVQTTHSGIELVHFCKNDNCSVWKGFKMPKSLGNVVFWRFIVPLLGNVQKIVGCKYAFLFAADLSDDGSLINYYQTDLHFEIPEDIGTSKPIYDLKCKFMCQTVNKLLKEQEAFFANFNPGEDYV